MTTPRLATSLVLCIMTSLLACKGGGSADALGAAPEGTKLCLSSSPADCAAQCEKGHAGSCDLLGEAQEKGAGVAKSLPQAVKSYERACTLGSMQGCNNLGTMYLAGDGVARDMKVALGWFEKACAGGRPPACYNAGVVHEHKLAPANPKAAAPFYEKACDGDHFNACTNLGTLYYTGSGVTKDLDRARTLYTKACKGGDKSACEAAKH